MMREGQPMVYRTSFCNFGHNLKTGRPVGHECYIIPPELLRAERELPFEQAIEVWRPWYANKGRSVVGRKEV